MLTLNTPYLVFLGATSNPLDAKTGRGLIDWRPELCVGQSRLPGCGVDLEIPDMTPAEAAAAGAGSLVIGIASTGGRIEDDWLGIFEQAIDAGLDIVSGMHTRLSSIESLQKRAESTGARLIDVRVPPAEIPIATGRKRTGRRLLTVGTDCCVGKKYTALAIQAEFARRNIAATFRATGQTGILIAGEGIPIDAVVADFVSGAAEQLSPDNDPAHWDIIEGQGSLFHPGYAAVTLGLLHGSQPDALVLCHDATRTHIDEHPLFPIPPLEECLKRYTESARLTNPHAQFVGISINSSGMSEAEQEGLFAAIYEQTGLPVVDPVRTGVGPIVDHLTE